MADPFVWDVLPKAAEAWAKTLGIVAGGAWVLYKFGLKREGQTAVDIEDIKYHYVPYGARYLVFVDVTIRNKGSVRVKARSRRRPAYRDATETLAYSADLRLRRIPEGLLTRGQIGWFSEPEIASPAESDIEADLLAEYVLKGKTDFFMEPSEVCHIGATVVMEAGTYLGMVTFIGAAGDHEFWRRPFTVEVPSNSSGRETTGAML
jgi:hypothetical protein